MMSNGSKSKNASSTKIRPPEANKNRTKEVGKVRPIRKPSKFSEVEMRAQLEEDTFKGKKLEETNEKCISLEEESLHCIDSNNAFLINPPIDPTKDFYTSKGRPVSPILHAEVIESQAVTTAQNSASQSVRSSEGGDSKDRRSKDSERVKVIVRSRPLSVKEKADGYESVVTVHSEKHEIEVRRPGCSDSEVKIFAFDAVYDNRTSQKELYDEAFKPLVESVLEGFNGTIFAYGQTGTGKTYTMEGVRDNEGEQGIIPNAFRHIFQQVAENVSKQYLIRASYLEIYQEEIRDLLRKDRKQQRELRESPTSGVYVKDLSTHLCSNFGEINELMTRGNKNRAVGATNMNEHSSRSHAIFMITIEMSEKWPDGRNHFKVGKLNLVDLAGSERQGKTGAAGERFKEATKINLSLSALGNVIAALVDGKSTHIPYRDSKLTRLLQDSLGGNSRTIMVATIGPASFNWEETITTLRYASRAKKIKNKPKVNEDPKDALLRQYQEEIERLRQELELKKSKQLKLFQPSELGEGKRRSRSRASTASLTSMPSNREFEERRIAELAALLEPYGLDPTTDPKLIMEKLEERRNELMQDNLTVKTEKDLLMQKLDEMESLLSSSGEECLKLSDRIGWLESKVLTGGKDLVDHTNEQEKLLLAKQQELAEQIEKYELTKKRLKEEKLTIEELTINAEESENDLYSKTRKYKKLTNRCQSMKGDAEKVQQDHAHAMRELETVLQELKKEYALKNMILENFIPPSSRRIMENRFSWNEEKQEYELSSLNSQNAILRPAVRRSMNLPLFNVSETGEVNIVKDTHFTNENILQLHPDMPKRRTKDYVPPTSDPYISSLIKRAINDAEKQINVECSGKSGRSRTHTAKLPSTPEYYKVGDSLIRRVRSARPISDGTVRFRDFSIVSNSDFASSERKFVQCTFTEMLKLSLSLHRLALSAHSIN